MGPGVQVANIVRPRPLFRHSLDQESSRSAATLSDFFVPVILVRAGG